MLRYVVRRLLLLVPILLGVSILIFFWIRALPGSPAESLLGERATPQLVHQLREGLGAQRLRPVEIRETLTQIDRLVLDRQLRHDTENRSADLGKLALDLHWASEFGWLNEWYHVRRET